MGGAELSTERPEGLTPSSALTVVEAASLAGVPRAEIEARIAEGSLLSESRGRAGPRGRGKVVVRLCDLADVYPAVLGRPDPIDGGEGDAGDPSGAAEPDEFGPDEVPPEEGEPLDRERLVPRSQEAAAVGAPLAEDASIRSAPRGALIQLCDDLETRLDLAERERRASTASLLMAQRRLLDLEADARRTPWRGATVGAAMLLSLGAIAVAVRAPDRAAAAVRAEVAPLAEDLDARLAAQLESVRGDAAATGAALRAAIADLGRAARAADAEDSERLDALAASLASELERSREAVRRTEEAVAAALAEGATERAAALDGLRDEDAASRARLESRLAEVESVLSEARSALESEREGRAADARAAAESAAALAHVIERLEARMTADRAAIDALRAEVEASRREARERAEAPAGGAPQSAGAGGATDGREPSGQPAPSRGALESLLERARRALGGGGARRPGDQG